VYFKKWTTRKSPEIKETSREFSIPHSRIVRKILATFGLQCEIITLTLFGLLIYLMTDLLFKTALRI